MTENNSLIFTYRNFNLKHGNDLHNKHNIKNEQRKRGAKHGAPSFTLLERVRSDIFIIAIQLARFSAEYIH